MESDDKEEEEAKKFSGTRVRKESVGGSFVTLPSEKKLKNGEAFAGYFGRKGTLLGKERNSSF